MLGFKMVEFDIYRRAEKKVRLKLSLEIHTLIFVVVNVILSVINMIFTPFNWWSIIVMLSWGLGYVIHITTYFIRNAGKSAFLIHLWSFLMVESMLIFINLAYPAEVYWFVYPLIAFLISISLHGVFYLMSLKESEEEKKTWYIKRIENEAKKIRKEIEGNK